MILWGGTITSMRDLTKKTIEWFKEDPNLKQRHLLEIYRWYRANKERCFKLEGECQKCPLGQFKNCNKVAENELITVYYYRDKRLDWDIHKNDVV